jgi:hypothetical protein
VRQREVWAKARQLRGGTGMGDKSTFVARVIENVEGATLTALVNEAVSNKVSLRCQVSIPI